jgi:hypothetical protein
MTLTEAIDAVLACVDAYEAISRGQCPPCDVSHFLALDRAVYVEVLRLEGVNPNYTVAAGRQTSFQHPTLLSWVGENRGRLLGAALTILRGYCAAGRPDMGLPARGSFEGWSDLVRSAVVWIDLPDPGETRVLLQDAADVTAECMAVLLECWEKMVRLGAG